jgi:hypothetical protein
VGNGDWRKECLILEIAVERERFARRFICVCVSFRNRIEEGECGCGCGGDTETLKPLKSNDLREVAVQYKPELNVFFN